MGRGHKKAQFKVDEWRVDRLPDLDTEDVREAMHERFDRDQKRRLSKRTYDHRFNKIEVTRNEDRIARETLSGLTNSERRDVAHAIGLISRDSHATNYDPKRDPDGTFLVRLVTEEKYSYLSGNTKRNFGESGVRKAMQKHMDSDDLYAGTGEFLNDEGVEKRGRRKQGGRDPQPEDDVAEEHRHMGITSTDHMGDSQKDKFRRDAKHGNMMFRRDSRSIISAQAFEQDMPFIGGISGTTRDFIKVFHAKKQDLSHEERELVIARYMLTLGYGGHHSFGEMIHTAQVLGYLQWMVSPFEAYHITVAQFEPFAKTGEQVSVRDALKALVREKDDAKLETLSRVVRSGLGKKLLEDWRCSEADLEYLGYRPKRKKRIEKTSSSEDLVI